MHILDNFGHIIISTINLGFVGFQVFGEGQLNTNYHIVVVGREESVAVLHNVIYNLFRELSDRNSNYQAGLKVVV